MRGSGRPADCTEPAHDTPKRSTRAAKLPARLAASAARILALPVLVLKRRVVRNGDRAAPRRLLGARRPCVRHSSAGPKISSDATRYSLLAGAGEDVCLMDEGLG